MHNEVGTCAEILPITAFQSEKSKRVSGVSCVFVCVCFPAAFSDFSGEF